MTLRRPSASPRRTPTPTAAEAWRGHASASTRDAVSDAEEALKHGDSDWRIAYNAARIYSQAAIAAETESRKTGPVADAW